MRKPSCHLRRLGHQIQGATSLEPTDLALIEGVSELELLGLAILVLELKGQVDTGSEVLETLDGDKVIRLNLVVVGRVNEGESEHALLLQVGLLQNKRC